MEHDDRFEAARGDEGRYKLLVDGITDYAIYMLDPTGIVTSWNPGAERFKGYKAQEIIGRHFSVFYSDEERARGEPELTLSTAIAEGRFEREGWRVRKDGGRFWAHVVVDAIHDPAGALLGFAKITRDLTECRASEEALRSSEAQFRLLVQSVTDYAIYMLDAEGRVSNWNAGAERIKGYRPDEIIGEHFSRFYTEEDRAAGAPAVGLETARREGRFEKEGWRVRKDGDRFWAHVVIDAIRDPAGRVIGFAKITRDITERMQAQRSLEQTREALFQSQKMEAIGHLTGGVAHDFNNLLMAVLGSLELLKKRLPADTPLMPLVDNAIMGAQRGTSLTQRMLAFARRQELNVEPVDLPAAVLDMLGFLERSIGPTIRVDMRFAPDLPRALTDPNQLEAAILNLAVNARDAMPGGGVITIAGEARTPTDASDMLKPGDYIVLSVADTGEGMDEDTLKRASEPFFTTKGVGKGTGLGLSMVHGLAAQSGGWMIIKSRKGEGARVELWLPAARSDQIGRTRVPISVLQERDNRLLSILVVDDDSLVLRNTTALLEDLGHHVMQATSGGEALEMIRQTPTLDLVITDQVMPRMTGLQLCDAVRALRPALPLMIATGYAEMPLDADANLLRIAKPFTQSELAEAVLRSVRAAVAG